MKKVKKITKKEIKRQERIAKKKKYKIWANAVKERDAHKCVISGNIERLNAHHIITRDSKLFAELRFDVNNGITLSQTNHKWSRDISAHGNSFVFCAWLQKNRPEQYNYLLNKVKELCPNLAL